MRKSIFLLSMLLILGLVVGGCAAPAGPGAAPDQSAATEAAPAEAAPAGPFEPMSMAAENCDYGGLFKSIEAVDQMTVKFTLCQPDPAFPAKVAFSSFAINDADYLQATGGGGELIEKPNGTGPYKLVDWLRGDQIIFERNEEYWGEPAIPQTLVFRWSAESAQRLVELQAGTVDGIDNPGPDDFAVIEADPNLQLAKRSGTNIFYIGMNNTYPPFDNERVRQAFAMAIDRQRIVDNFYPAGSSVATQFMPPSIFGYTDGLTWYDYNPDEAKKILEEEGVLPGFKTTITYRDVVRGYLPNPGVVAQDIQAQLADIGVEAEIVVMESGAFLDAADRGEIAGFHMLGWGADYPDATNFLDFHFGKGASAQFGNGFPDIWDALNEGATKAKPEDRQPWYDKANELIKQHVPMIPVAHGGNGAAFKADVEGAYASDIGAEQFALMNPGGRDTFVWLQNGEPAGLYCADESDGEALRACEQVMQSLLAYEPGTGDVVASLATEWTANDELTEWVFKLREGVKFHNGATLDANDVVLSYVVQWDASHPLHVGRDGSFTYFPGLFGGFLNAPE
ncbi:MAG TPA: peptide ABC transporter substrate-binding protein [Chloroflexi bacterium]|nr:peptide ABC transporter substrate-binding protein [Chloroflexota bacterium]HHW87012.1 peptide ABC transporter substrate-binding protein [Chloroflexota bacterium]